eukprot:TRINITY_DN44093_c0_g1_i2.p1 TRINITY_DN44093_c0_g1~~TRINITY_DN44093_c0_g1_i2.p1  ORF type:complete len:361 (+),score=65.29 TRINITY_DN44093_c0_g1_i2:273-1355(+)
MFMGQCSMSSNQSSINRNIVSRSPVWLLGVPYPMDAIHDQAPPLRSLNQHFKSLLWFTYRSQISPDAIPPFESDAGWGCMMRSGQMLLGQTLVFLLTPESRDWRLSSNDPHPSSPHRQILRLFDDCVESPYSLPCIALEGLHKHNMELGEWYGPTTMCHVLRDLVARHQPDQLQVLVCSDGCIYRDQAINAGTRGTDHWSPLLLLLPLRLGLETLNPLYKPALLRTFAIQQTVGVMGGKPSASLYFVGAEDENLLYLDPHIVQERVEMRGRFETSSFHCSRIRQMRVDALDPCLAVGFLCQVEEEFEFLCAELAEIERKLGPDGRSIISIQETQPLYSEDAAVLALGSGEDEEDDDFVLM